MTTPAVPPPPRPPYGLKISFDKDGNLCVSRGFSKWRAPAATVTVQTVDQTSKPGRVVVVLSTPSGETLRHPVKAAFGDRTRSWAVAFNAWQAAVRAAGDRA